MLNRRIFLGFLLLIGSVPAFSATQQERRAFIDKLIRMKVFTRTSAENGVSKAWTGPAFSELDYDTKNSFCNVVYAYYLNEASVNKTMRLIDGSTNKDVGVFSEVYGGLKLK